MSETINPHILVVDDDPQIRELLEEYLTENQLRVSVVSSGRQMAKILADDAIDLVVLDLRLAGEDGMAIAKTLREQSAIPIVMLTGVRDEADRVMGLELGADDYLTKPFAPRELLARVRAILRRVKAAPAKLPVRRYAFDRFVIDLDSRSIQFGDASDDSLQLTSAEFDLLGCFVLRPRRVLTRDQILDWTRGRSAEPFDRTVDMLISRLRKKLDAASPGSGLITTVRNGGYLFTPSVKQVS